MELPKICTVLSNVRETADIFTLTLSTPDKKPFEFLPGQFNMMYLFGSGEIPLSISSHPDNKQELIHTIKAVGPVTQGLQKLQKGDEIGIRGPFGTSWPMERTGCDVLIVAGGVAFPPLRTAIYQFAAKRDQYKKMTILYGARTPSDLFYADDIKYWREHGFDVQISVDKGDASWKGHEGVVTKLIESHVYNPKDTLAFSCGPEIMMKFAIQELSKAGVEDDNMYLSMERNMQCGVGFCGHCQYGPYFICKDGPVFSYTQLKKWFMIKEL